MKRVIVLRLLSCCIAGILLAEVPMQVAAAPSAVLDTAEASESRDTDEDELYETDVDFDEKEISEEEEKSVRTEEKPETEKDSETGGELETEEDFETEKEPEKKNDSEAEKMSASLVLTGLQYGILPEYSEDFDADAAADVISGLTEALEDGDAEIREYAISPDMLKDALTWIAGHEEEYYTLLPYVDYTYVEKDDCQEVQTVSVSRLSTDRLLSLSPVRREQDVKVSFTGAEEIEQYKLFQISENEVREFSAEEGQEILIDRIESEDASVYRYVICGYQIIEDEQKLCAFSKCMDLVYETVSSEDTSADPAKDAAVTVPEEPILDRFEKMQLQASATAVDSIAVQSVDYQILEESGATEMEKVTGVKTESASCTSVKISWRKVAGASGYKVYYSTSKDSGYKILKTISSTSCKHTKLTTGKTYYYKVRAYKTVDGKKVYGDYSKAVKAKAAPAAAVARKSATTYNSVTLSWKKVSGADGYAVYRSKSKNGTWEKLKTVKSDSTKTYKDKGLVPGKTYYYKVRAYKTVNGKKVYGAYSEVVKTKPELKKPSLKKSTVNYNSVRLTWKKISGASGYQIYRSTSMEGTYKRVKSITGSSTLSYTDSGLTAGTTYYYKIRAYRKVDGKKRYSEYSKLVDYNAEEDLYTLLEEGIRNRIGMTDDSYIDISGFGFSNADGSEGREILSRIFRKVLYDHPEFFYVTGGYYRRGSKDSLVGVKPMYYEFAKSRGAIDAFHAAVETALAQVEGITDPVEQMLILHDYLVTNNVYSWEVAVGREKDAPKQAWNAYGALVEGSTVCRGYALAYRVLLNRLGINCQIVSSEEMNHVWNMVEIDGKWYHVDVNRANNIVPTLRGRCRHSHFLVSDESILASGYHDWVVEGPSGDESAPECSSKKYETGWAFNDSTDFPVYRKNGKFYYIRRINAKKCTLYRGKLSEPGTELLSIPLYTYRDNTGYYTRSGVVWANDYMYYVNMDLELICYRLADGQSISMGRVPFTARPSQDGYYGVLQDGIGLFYSSQTGEIVAVSRTRRNELARFTVH